MKKLVPIKTPNDYHYQGKTQYVNPDEVSSVSSENGQTLVVFKDGQQMQSQNTVEEVVAAIEAAL